MSESRRPEVFGREMERVLTREGRYRLSRFIQDVQAAFLFNAFPPDAPYPGALEQFIRSHRADIAELARVWEEFRSSGKRFVGSYGPEFLRAYLAYYSTVNALKLQLVLDDVLRRGAWEPGTGDLRVVDLGTGPGTTFLAIADWLLAYRSVAGAAAVPQSVRCTGIDVSGEALKAAGRTADCIAEAVRRWLAHPPRPGALAPKEHRHTWRSVAAGCAKPDFLQADLSEPASAEMKEAVAKADLVVASYILNELRDAGRTTQHFERLLEAARPGCLVLLIEPGDRFDAGRLMGWRRAFLERRGGWEVVSPCGDRFGQSLPDYCHRCWPSRREAFHPTPLYGEFVRHLPMGATRPLSEEGDEKHLSWTYTVLRRKASWSSPRRERWNGRLDNAYESVVVGNYPADGSRMHAGRGVPMEVVKLCPAEIGARNSAELEYPAARAPRWLTFGQRIVFRGFAAAPTSDGSVRFTEVPGARLEPADDMATEDVSTVASGDETGREWLDYAFPEVAWT